jgi:hypothetical protein
MANVPLQVMGPAALAAALTCAWGAVWAQTLAKPPVGIYTCVDDKGRRLTADRPIPECAGREQQVLNRDGSVRAVHPPTLTADERSEQEARDRAAAEVRAAAADAVRRDRNLMARFPTEAAHSRAREAALDTVRLAIKSTEIRLRDLAAERKPLKDEAEFYQGKQMPAKLKAAIDANETASDALRAAAVTQEAELGRVNRLYDAELERLRKLWSGAPAGSLGPLPPSLPSASPATPPPAAARPASH